MGCVHADGGNPRYVCNACEKDEPGLRVSNRGWVRGDVVPEIQEEHEPLKILTAPLARELTGIPHKIAGQTLRTSAGKEYFYICQKCHREWTSKQDLIKPEDFARDCTHVVVSSPVGPISVPADSKQAYEAGRRAGNNEMLDAVRASLKEYPNGGGDSGVMGEVERIVGEATAYWRGEISNLRETLAKIRTEIQKVRVQ